MLVKLNSRVGGRISTRLRPRGFSLVEVMVGALVLVVALAGLVPFFLTVLRESASVRYVSSATNVAEQRMELIRQLDFREIADAGYLDSRFGNSEEVRGINFSILYDVATSDYGEGVLKEITVTVKWDAPPKVRPAVLTSMFHQQYVGPRVSQLEVFGTIPDPAGTPFNMLQKDSVHQVWCHVAEADWGLVIENLNEPGMAATNSYALINIVDENGVTLPIGNPANNYEITDLKWTVDAVSGLVTDVYFEYFLDSSTIPDGYWEFQTVAFNQYNEPGNVWRLRTRVDNGAPDAPLDFTAVVQEGNESIRLLWQGGDDRDRDHYEIDRRAWDHTLGAWDYDWTPLDHAVDPNSSQLLDQGSILSQLDPWGDATQSNYYLYRIRAVDLDGFGAERAGEYAQIGEAITPKESAGAVVIPPLSSTTTTTSTVTTSSTSTSTTIITSFSVQIVNNVNRVFTLTLKDEDGVVVPISPSTVDKTDILTLTGLSAGSYLITATAPGHPDRVASFTLDGPEDDGMIVMTIL